MFQSFITLFENSIISNSKVKCNDDYMKQHRNHLLKLERAPLKQLELIWLAES